MAKKQKRFVFTVTAKYRAYGIGPNMKSAAGELERFTRFLLEGYGKVDVQVEREGRK